MKLGIVGLPNAGKSTLFNALTAQNVSCADYPFCTVEPNVGQVEVPDGRLLYLAKAHKSKKVVPAFVVFTDIAGLVRGASRGAGLGNKFLAHIRETDAIIHVVRGFPLNGGEKPNPMDDAETVNLELALSDLEIAEKRLLKAQKKPGAGAETTFLKRVISELENGVPPAPPSNEIEERLFAELNFISNKSVLYALNLDEKAIANPEAQPYFAAFSLFCAQKNASFLTVSAKIEEELLGLDESEKSEFLSEYGLTDADTGLKKIIKQGYQMLDLISFLTTGADETRAWTIKRGTRAPQAAGKIHSDFERGFIRAECVAFDDLARFGSYGAAREAGAIRSEGKDYVVADGDVINFRFNV